MKRRIWALITGAIRSDLYFRVILIKLCDMRAKGVIEEIVFSTWLGEIDKFEGLREILQELDIVIVEKPYIDEILEKYTEISFERQRTQIFNALQIIPHDVYVIKLRTDYIFGISRLFKAVQDNINLDVNRFGSFPLIYYKKILMQIYNFKQLLFANDRFFFASREDISKLSLPVMHNMARKYNVYAENKLMFGYAYHFYPLLRDAGDIIPIGFYDSLIDYCNKHSEESLVIPRLVHRLYALACVFVYTQVRLIDYDYAESDGQIQISDLYRDKIKTNNQISKIVLGDIKDSQLANVFKDELRNIAINSPKAHGYSYQEYMELRSFAVDKLGNDNLIGEYPFYNRDVIKKSCDVDKETASSLLLEKYHDSTNTTKIANLIDEDFDSPVVSLYNQMGPLEKLSEKLQIELCRVGVFDLNIGAIFNYGEKLLLYKGLFDVSTWNQAIKYILSHVSFGALSSGQLVICYDYLKNYRLIFPFNQRISESKRQLDQAVVRVAGRIGGSKATFESEEDFVDVIIKELYKSNDREHVQKCLPLIETLAYICQHTNPFSQEILSQLRELGYGAFVDEVEKKYVGKIFRFNDWFVSDKLMILMNQNDIKSLIQYTEVVEGKREVEALARYMLSVLWNMPQETRNQAINAIDSLGTRLAIDIFPVKLVRLIRNNRLEINKEDMSIDSNFTLLLEMLYKCNALKQSINLSILEKTCFKDLFREMLLHAFLRIESDKRLEFFSMKNGHELWLHYVPYNENEYSRFIEVPICASGKTWPEADRLNMSALAACITFMDNDVFVSAEMSAKDTDKVRTLAEMVGYEENNSSGASIRLFTKRIHVEGENGLKQAVNVAMDEFCKVGEKVVSFLDNIKV